MTSCRGCSYSTKEHFYVCPNCGVEIKSEPLQKLSAELNFIRKQLVCLPIIIAFIVPSIILMALEVIYSHKSVGKALALVLRAQFASGENLFLIAVLSSVPFVALSLYAFVSFLRQRHHEFFSLYMTSLGVVTGALVYFHLSMWLPLYTPHGHISSTSAIAYLFAPFYGIAALIIGLCLGLLIYAIFRLGNNKDT